MVVTITKSFAGVIVDDTEDDEMEELEEELEDLVTCKIFAISPYGELYVQFSEDMLPIDVEEINEEILDLQIVSADPEFDQQKLAFTWQT
jgi:hypothetical protein